MQERHALNGCGGLNKTLGATFTVSLAEAEGRDWEGALDNGMRTLLSCGARPHRSRCRRTGCGWSVSVV